MSELINILNKYVKDSFDERKLSMRHLLEDTALKGRKELFIKRNDLTEDIYKWLIAEGFKVIHKTENREYSIIRLADINSYQTIKISWQ